MSVCVCVVGGGPVFPIALQILVGRFWYFYLILKDVIEGHNRAY